MSASDRAQAGIRRPTGRDLIHAFELEAILHETLERMFTETEGRYATKLQVVTAINVSMAKHTALRHTPWYRRLIAWALEPIFAARGEQLPREFNPRAMPAEPETLVTEGDDTDEDDEDALQRASSPPKVHHTGFFDGTQECACGEFHFVEEARALNAPALTNIDPGAREEYHQEPAPEPAYETTESGVKVRDRRGVRE